MISFSELHEIIEKELADLYYPSTPKNLYDPIKYVLNIGGKKNSTNFDVIISSIIFKSYKSFEDNYIRKNHA